MKKPTIRYKEGASGALLLITRLLVVPLSKGIYHLNIDFSNRCEIDSYGGSHNNKRETHSIFFEEFASKAITEVRFAFPESITFMLGEISKKTYHGFVVESSTFDHAWKRFEKVEHAKYLLAKQQRLAKKQNGSTVRT